MFFGLYKKGKSKVMEDTIRETINNGGSTIVADGKESNKEDLQAEKKLEVVVVHGDFIIKENSIQHQLNENFFAELKGDVLYLSSIDDCSSCSSVHNQTIVGNNCTMSGGSMNIVQSGNGGIQTIGNHRGCSIQKSNGVEVRNYNGKKIEIITTKDIPIYINGELIRGTTGEVEDKEDDDSIERYPLDGLCVSDIVVNGSGGMIATNEHTYHNMPILITKGSGDIVFDCRQEKMNFEGFACFVRGSGDIEVKNIETENLEVEIQGSGDVRLVNVSGDKANFNIQGSGDILGRKVIFETKNKRILGSGDISGI